MLRFRRELDRPLLVADVAAFLGSSWRGAHSAFVTGVAPLLTAGPADLSFCAGRHRRDEAVESSAAVILVEADLPTDLDGRALVVDNPRLAFRDVIVHFFGMLISVPAIDSGARVSPSARIDPSVSVGPGAVIDDDVEIGAESVVGPNVVVMHGTRIGARVTIGPGTVIGADGFGFAERDGQRVRMPHVGCVVIEDDVEIGSNCTIDRGALEDTRIGRGSKIDSLVHIGHGVIIGEDVVIVAQCGVSGSVTIGDGVMMGGQAGVADHVTIAPGVIVGSRAAVMKSIPDAGITVSGTPARPIMEHLRAEAHLRGMRELVERVRRLEARLADARR